MLQGGTGLADNGGACGEDGEEGNREKLIVRRISNCGPAFRDAEETICEGAPGGFFYGGVGEARVRDLRVPGSSPFVLVVELGTEARTA